jgi:hypothetical protein
MAPNVLSHKLEGRSRANPEQAWNLARWPSRLSDPGPHRFFVASEGAWRGYFALASEALFNPRDPSAPITLLFDARSWQAIPPVPVRHFRGFTYAVPVLPQPEPLPSPSSSPLLPK